MQEMKFKHAKMGRCRFWCYRLVSRYTEIRPLYVLRLMYVMKVIIKKYSFAIDFLLLTIYNKT